MGGVWGRKVCARCAERVKAAAQICRYCGYEFPKTFAEPKAKPWLRNMLISVAFVGLLAAGLYSLKPERSAVATPEAMPETVSAAESPLSVDGEPPLDELAVGATLNWVADEAPNELLRRAGPYRIRITKEREDELVAPVVELSGAGQTARMKGEAVSSGYSHKISVIQLLQNAAPVVMLQSFSGGAHCCNVVQLAGFSRGKLRVIELGTWDGDEIPLPIDISNDGIADFQLLDNSFLYAFASYASSYAPPQILNVVNGQVRDVSRQPAFRTLYADTTKEAGKVCRTAETGDQRNGACPAYVAAAARLGKLDEAWAAMIAAYDAQTDWDFPAGCRIATSADCPSEQVINFKSYPEALLHFLKQRGYISTGWRPPEHYEVEQPSVEEGPERAPVTI